jgi:hypothetical protein
LLASATLLGVCGALFDPNLGALVPDLVEPGQVQAANGLMDLTGRIARVAGPGSAGILLAVMPMAGLFWLDAVTFAFSGLALGLLGRRWRVSRHEPAPIPQAVAAGEAARAGRGPRIWALLRSHPDTATVLAVHSCGIFAGAVSMAMPALLATRLHAGAGTYGMVLAVVGVGSLVGNTVAGNVRLPMSLPGVYCGTWVLCGVLLALTGAVASLPMLLVVSVASGVLSPFLSVALMTHFAQFSSPARRRLLTVDQTLIRTAGTLSMLLIPALAAADPAVGFVAGGTGTAVVAGTAGVAVLWRARAAVTMAGGEAVSDLEPVLSPAGRR